MSRSRWRDRLVRYPDDLTRRYRRSGLWGTRTIADELRAVATAHPRREAVVALDGRMTYRELDESTDLLAAGLAGLGLVPGDPVLFQVTNRLGAIVAWYGVLKAGLVPVCTLAAHRGHEVGEISRRTGAVAHLVEAGTRGFDLVGFAAGQRRDHPTLRHILVLGATGGTSGDTGGVPIESLGAGADPQAARTIVEGIQRGIDPDDVAVFQLSGGTTGVPKVIPRLHAEYWYNAAAYARSWGWSPDTRVAHLIPVIHNAGIVCAVHGPHSAGACLVLIKDVISRGGEKINAEEVELLLLRHPRIIDAAAVAMPDPRLGERTCAYIVVRGEPLTMAEIQEHFRQLQVATFKWPERIEHLAEIPRTLVGKTDKKRLQSEIAAKTATELADLQSRS